MCYPNLTISNFATIFIFMVSFLHSFLEYVYFCNKILCVITPSKHMHYLFLSAIDASTLRVVFTFANSFFELAMILTKTSVELSLLPFLPQSCVIYISRIS